MTKSLPPALPGNSLAEAFGHAVDDSSPDARLLWKAGICPFTSQTCSKINHNTGLVYGTCSAATHGKTVIICPVRLYAGKYASIRRVAAEAFGDLPFMMFGEFWEKRRNLKRKPVVVALGQNSGKEVKLGSALSMDWILAVVLDQRLVEYLGVEVQSIDVIGNYRDNWHFFREQKFLGQEPAPPSEHGYNWANVHKRMIPQLIRKGLVFSSTSLVKHGLFFILPEIVYCKFEDVVGPLTPVNRSSKETITVHTYRLGSPVSQGKIRKLEQVRTERFLLKEFAEAFISGVNLPKGTMLDRCVKEILDLE